MSYREYSLRSLVRKWLGPEADTCVRITDFSHTRHKPWRYVRVTAMHPSGTLAFVFFRHEDGTWGMYPPSDRGPTLSSAKMFA